MFPNACTTLSRISDTSQRSSGIRSLYITEGESMGLGDRLSCLSRTRRDSGDEDRWGRDRSGDTHLGEDVKIKMVHVKGV